MNQEVSPTVVPAGAKDIIESTAKTRIRKALNKCLSLIIGTTRRAVKGIMEDLGMPERLIFGDEHEGQDQPGKTAMERLSGGTTTR